MTQPLRCNRAELTKAVCAMATVKPWPIRLSHELMRAWCGSLSPTEDLIVLMRDRGFDIDPATGIGGGGWDVRRIAEPMGLFVESA